MANEQLTTTPVAAPPSDEQSWRNAIQGRFDIGQQSYLEAIPDLSQSIAASKSNSQLQSNMAKGVWGAADYLANRRTGFDGLEDRYTKTAFDTNNAANKQRVAGEAAAGITGQFDNLRGQTNRNLARSGVNPASGRALAMNNQLAVQQAAASAGAQNKAMNDLDVLADSRQRTAIGFGSNLTGQALNAASTASNLGNNAMQAAAVPLSQRLKFAGGISDIYGNAARDYGDLWQSQNLTAAQRAGIDAQNNASDSSDTAALIGAGIKLFTPNNAGESVASSLWSGAKNLFSGDNSILG